MCDGHMHRGSHVQVPNSTCISCVNSSLLGCLHAVQEVLGLMHGKDMSVSGSLVEDGDNLVVKSLHQY
jgi:hypothetical protein